MNLIRVLRCVFSIPYGKGKGEFERLHLISNLIVSIPYGKGKDENKSDAYDTIRKSYQFPMGKVKKEGNWDTEMQERVSISYGKGKDRNHRRHRLKNQVSIPYGKGKEFIVLIQSKKIN